ncbi:pseudouridine synthase [Desulfitibacter alkalitolerans]|uniref:pseudouridine synthase n=1 Tax=Desulfitibacter alkalitolerans TaxID=264641 RepID=UPI000488656D|nr:pseudouridine synthase [Desulfitibacter alkalitolerans]
MERLQKFLAAAGIASRRKSEELIQQGRVKVNGQVVTTLGAKIDPSRDRIHIDGKPLDTKEEPVYILLNKPKGYISTVRDTHGRKTVMDLIPKHMGRLYPVGRLDSQTTGLLLLTNDGELTYKLTHPKHEFSKTYRTLVKGKITHEAINQLEQGIPLEDGLTAPAIVNVLEIKDGKSLVEITIHEGKNRQVRRMFQAVGFPVQNLKRISFGFLNLKGVSPGKFRMLTSYEINNLKRSVL